MMIHTYKRANLIVRAKNVVSFLLLTLLALPSYAQKSPLFSEYAITLPFNLTQPVLALNILENPGNELVAIGLTAEGQRQLAVYAFNSLHDKMQLIDLLTLGQQFFAYDQGVAQPSGLQSLYFLSSERIFEYVYVAPTPETDEYTGPAMAAPHIPAVVNDLQSNSYLKPLHTVSTMYFGTKSDALLQSNFSQDINDDQQDDFILSQFEKVDLWLSKPGTKERVTQSLSIPALMIVEGEALTFKPHELFLADMNRDGRSDLVLVETGQLKVFEQNSQGTFDIQGKPVHLAEDIEGINWWDKIDADGQQLSQSNLKHKMVELITDINGDAVADLVVRFAQSSGVLDRTNDYEVYYGQLKSQGLMFAKTADTRIQSSSTLSDFRLVDLDNDGRQEVMVSAFELGVSQIISALLSSSIEQEILLFKMDDNQAYPAKPTESQEVEITFSLSSGSRGEPMVKLIDLNGDGLKDFVFSEEDEQIRVNMAVNDAKRLFNRRSEKYSVQVPKNAKAITHSDINLDGKTDLILHYSRVDPPELLNKVIVLIAN
ncbi:VCBS repeat-containing protein [Paraglaciecola sp.]|uniref:FG-GAP repeat domain-containing protein n=2 Tax=Pseudomonadati TaxID=3379134 RepID=UPI00273F5DA6|nr:VCBS repeat-containing protein [Paraglaciecola sp.]MDP5029803.1 VCBS repeat-containing protein [Paraglaciecola sp.]